MSEDHSYPGSLPCGCYPTYHNPKCSISSHAREGCLELRERHYNEKRPNKSEEVVFFIKKEEPNE